MVSKCLLRILLIILQKSVVERIKKELFERCQVSGIGVELFVVGAQSCSKVETMGKIVAAAAAGRIPLWCRSTKTIRWCCSSTPGIRTPNTIGTRTSSVAGTSPYRNNRIIFLLKYNVLTKNLKKTILKVELKTSSDEEPDNEPLLPLMELHPD